MIVVSRYGSITSSRSYKARARRSKWPYSLVTVRVRGSFAVHVPTSIAYECRRCTGRRKATHRRLVVHVFHYTNGSCTIQGAWSRGGGGTRLGEGLVVRCICSSINYCRKKKNGFRMYTWYFVFWHTKEIAIPQTTGPGLKSHKSIHLWLCDPRMLCRQSSNDCWLVHGLLCVRGHTANSTHRGRREEPVIPTRSGLGHYSNQAGLFVRTC